MSIFKCKMCGGTLEIQPNATVAECEYCGTTQTLPKLDDGRKANLFDRANHFRRNNEFDKAVGIYEQILNEDGSDAEIYWSLVLCRYGVEYVEDPATHKRVPTVNRAQFTSIFDDENYKSALNYADGYQRSIYEDEAKAINEIQKGILAISQKEEPFDVFICYKETDNSGRRTPDSVLATDLYHRLMQEGFKVFFSRITLEDKLGIAYEPYIFAALNSAKVMVVLGTRPEYFNAVWVKNEWNRYLALIRSGAKKILIPAYKDMDPYDLPEEFSHLQAQDMSKLGFMQDLIHGIKKLIGTKSPAPVNDNTEQLLKRAFLALEDGDWKQADGFCEQVLNQNAEHPRAYLGKLMAELHVHQENELALQQEPFDSNPLYKKVQRFDDGFLVVRLQSYNKAIRNAKEQAVQEKLTQKEQWRLQLTSKKPLTRLAITAVVVLVVGLVAMLGVKSYQKKEAAYEEALLLMKTGSYTEAIEAFAALNGFWDSEDQIAAAEATLEEIRLQEDAYDAAIALLEDKQYAEAVAAFEALGEYKEASAYLTEAQIGVENIATYKEAAVAMEDCDYDAAAQLYKTLGDFEDSEEQLLICNAEILYAKFRSCIHGEETVEYDTAEGFLISLSAIQTPLAVEYQDSGYFELANLVFAEDKVAEAEYYLAKIKYPDQFDELEPLAEEVHLLKLYQEAQAIEVVDDDTKVALQALIDQLPEDYREVAELKQKIANYNMAVEASIPKIVGNDIIIGTWEINFNDKGIKHEYKFNADGTYSHAVITTSFSLPYLDTSGTYSVMEISGALYLYIDGKQRAFLSQAGQSFSSYYDTGHGGTLYRS